MKAPGLYFPELMVKRALKFIDETRSVRFLLRAVQHSTLPGAGASATRGVVQGHEGSRTVVRYHHDHHRFLHRTGDRSVGEKRAAREHDCHIHERQRALGGNRQSFAWTNTKAVIRRIILQLERRRSYRQMDRAKGHVPRGWHSGAGDHQLPGKAAKGRGAGQVITAMDWFPTVLDLCGVNQPADALLDGHNLRPIIESSDAKSTYKTLHFTWGNKWAVREGD